MGRLDGKNVVVTGSTGGVGVAVVSRLLAAGARCWLPMVEPEVPAHLPWAEHERVSARGGVRLDDEASVQAYYADLPELWASVHLVGGFTMGPLREASAADFDRMMALNARTCFLCCREAARRLREGRIVNVAARQVLEPAADVAVYTASKAAVAALTRGLALELRESGVLVNAIVPSVIDTPANRSAMPEADASRWPKPSELAETILFLASPENTLTSGALVPVFGRA